LAGGAPMAFDFEDLTEHDATEDCPVCRAQQVVDGALVPAAASWEFHHELPRFSLALHGAAGLLGAMLEQDIPRDEIEAALSRVLDDIEQQIAEDKALGGPPMGSA
jgi:hypothetical protein